jgi:type IV pilus assembly protein PilP
VQAVLRRTNETTSGNDVKSVEQGLDRGIVIVGINTRLRIALILGLVITITGCGNDGLDDLRSFVKNEHKNRKPRVEPLPEIKIPPSFAYPASDKADPFSAANLSPKSTQAKTQKSLPLYLLTRRKGPLEAYPLDALKMVGTLERKNEIWVVIKAPDGSMHRAKPGDYMGKNYGMITKITENKVSLVEKVQNAIGDWVDRQAAISISE